MSWAHHMIGVELVFSFLGCILLVVVAKSYGRLVERHHDYYDK